MLILWKFLSRICIDNIDTECNVVKIYIFEMSCQNIYLKKKNLGSRIIRHSSEIRGLCLMKCSSKMLQNLSHFWNTKTHIVFFRVSFRAALFSPLINALVDDNIDQGINKGKNKVARNEKQNKKNYVGFRPPFPY